MLSLSLAFILSQDQTLHCYFVFFIFPFYFLRSPYIIYFAIKHVRRINSCRKLYRNGIIYARSALCYYGKQICQRSLYYFFPIFFLTRKKNRKGCKGNAFLSIPKIIRKKSEFFLPQQIYNARYRIPEKNIPQKDL